MAEPIVKFNNATGSDTAASGYAATANLSGTAAATVSSSAVVTLLVDNPDLSAVVADDLMWVDSSSGRQFSKVVSVDNTGGIKTVTCADTFANTEGTRNWGIGGKRKTLDNADSRTLFGTTGWKPGWIAEVEDAQSLTSELTIAASGDSTNGPTALRGSSGNITITQTANAICIHHSASTNSILLLENLKIENSNGTKTNAHGVNVSTTTTTVINHCDFGDVTNTLNTGVRRSAGNPNYMLRDTNVHHCTGIGISFIGSGFLSLFACTVYSNGSHGIDRNGSIGNLKLMMSLIYNNSGDGVRLPSSPNFQFIFANTINGNTGDGIDATATTAISSRTIIINNTITGNGGYGINATSGSDSQMGFADYNNYGTGATANTSGAYNNLSAGSHDVNLDPQYVNAANGNFAIGTNLKALGFPGLFPSGLSTGYFDIGAVQREEPTGGSGSAHIIGA